MNCPGFVVSRDKIQEACDIALKYVKDYREKDRKSEVERIQDSWLYRITKGHLGYISEEDALEIYESSLWFLPKSGIEDYAKTMQKALKATDCEKIALKRSEAAWVTSWLEEK